MTKGSRVSRFAMVVSGYPPAFTLATFMLSVERVACPPQQRQQAFGDSATSLWIIRTRTKTTKNRMLSWLADYNLLQLDIAHKLIPCHYLEYRGLLSGISVHKRCPESDAFAECMRMLHEFKKASPPAAIITHQQAAVVDADKKKKTICIRRAVRYRSFILRYTVEDGSGDVFFHTPSFRLLQIKKVTTSSEQADALLLSHVVLHTKRSKKTVYECINAYNAACESPRQQCCLAHYAGEDGCFLTTADARFAFRSCLRHINAHRAPPSKDPRSAASDPA